jgi:hypothetical protein
MGGAAYPADSSLRCSPPEMWGAVNVRAAKTVDAGSTGRKTASKGAGATGVEVRKDYSVYVED